MRKPKTYFTIINVDVFKTGILVIVNSSIKGILSDLNKIFDSINIKGEDKEADIKTITNYLDPDDNGDVTALGHCITTGNTNDVVVIFRYDNPSQISMEVLVHEMYHATKRICESRLVEDEETEAYLLEHLVHTMLNKIDDYEEEKEKGIKIIKKKPTKKKNDKHPKEDKGKS